MAQGDRVIKAVLSHALTWLALVIVGLLEAAFILWFQPSIAMTLVALAVGVLALAAWPVMFVRSHSFARGLYRLPEAVNADQEDKLQTLASDFEHLDFAQGSAQLKLLREKFDNLSEIMKRRLNAGEITYARYLGMAEQVYLSAIDNLNEVAVALRSISTIDPDYIEVRLHELYAGGQPSEDQEQEFTALQHRSSLFDQQKERVARLVAQNESAMTVLDKTATALAQTRTAKGQATMDAEAAIAELERLAGRAGDYAVTK